MFALRTLIFTLVLVFASFTTAHALTKTDQQFVEGATIWAAKAATLDGIFQGFIKGQVDAPIYAEFVKGLRQNKQIPMWIDSGPSIGDVRAIEGVIEGKTGTLKLLAEDKNIKTISGLSSIAIVGIAQDMLTIKSVASQIMNYSGEEEDLLAKLGAAGLQVSASTFSALEGINNVTNLAGKKVPGLTSFFRSQVGKGLSRIGSAFTFYSLGADAIGGKLTEGLDEANKNYVAILKNTISGSDVVVNMAINRLLERYNACRDSGKKLTKADLLYAAKGSPEITGWISDTSLQSTLSNTDIIRKFLFYLAKYKADEDTRAAEYLDRAADNTLVNVIYAILNAHKVFDASVSDNSPIAKLERIKHKYQPYRTIGMSGQDFYKNVLETQFFGRSAQLTVDALADLGVKVTRYLDGEVLEKDLEYFAYQGGETLEMNTQSKYGRIAFMNPHLREKVVDALSQASRVDILGVSGGNTITLQGGYVADLQQVSFEYTSDITLKTLQISMPVDGSPTPRIVQFSLDGLGTRCRVAATSMTTNNVSLVAEYPKDYSQQISTFTKSWTFSHNISECSATVLSSTYSSNSNLRISGKTITIDLVPSTSSPHNRIELQLKNNQNDVVYVSNSQKFYSVTISNYPPRLADGQSRNFVVRDHVQHSFKLNFYDKENSTVSARVVSASNGGASISGNVLTAAVGSGGQQNKVVLELSDGSGSSEVEITLIRLTSQNLAWMYSDLMPTSRDYDYDDIAVCLMQGIASGQPDPDQADKRLFRPKEDASYAEVLKMLLLAGQRRGLLDISTLGTYISTYPDWAAPYNTYAKQHGLLEIPNNDLSRYYPTREEVAGILATLLNLSEKTDGLTLNLPDFQDSHDFTLPTGLAQARLLAAFGYLPRDRSFSPGSRVKRHEIASMARRILMAPTAEVRPLPVPITYGKRNGSISVSNIQAADFGDDYVLENSSGAVDKVYFINSFQIPSAQIPSNEIKRTANLARVVLNNRGVINIALSEPFDSIVNDRDGDLVPDLEDGWPGDSRYKYDHNSNGIPDILDEKYNLENNTPSDVVQIGAVEITIADLIVDWVDGGLNTPPVDPDPADPTDDGSTAPETPSLPGNVADGAVAADIEQGLFFDTEGTVGYLADGTGGLKVFDYSDKSKPVLKTAIDRIDIYDSTALHLHVDYDYLYVAYENHGIGVYSIEDDPLSPVFLQHLEGDSVYVIDKGHTLVSCTGGPSLKLYDLHNKKHIVSAASVSLGSDVNVAAKGEGSIFVGTDRTLHVLDVDNPYNPSVLNTYNVDDSVNILFYDKLENVLYAGVGNQVNVYTVNNNSNTLALVQSFRIPSSETVSNIVLVGDSVYVADIFGNYYIYSTLANHALQMMEQFTGLPSGGNENKKYMHIEDGIMYWIGKPTAASTEKIIVNKHMEHGHMYYREITGVARAMTRIGQYIYLSTDEGIGIYKDNETEISAQFFPDASSLDDLTLNAHTIYGPNNNGELKQFRVDDSRIVETESVPGGFSYNVFNDFPVTSCQDVLYYIQDRNVIAANIKFAPYAGRLSSLQTAFQARELEAYGRYVYAADNSNLTIIQTDEQGDMRAVASRNTGAVEIRFAGSHAFFLNSESLVTIYDVSNPANPISQATITGAGFKNISATREYLAISTDSSTTLYNITQKTSPAAIKTINMGGIPLISGNTCFIAENGTVPNRLAAYNFVIEDSDGDGLNDFIERYYYSNLDNDKNTDSDGDGLSFWEEMLHLADPKLKDTDGDGLSDALEIEVGLDLNQDNSQQDLDNDGLTNKLEAQNDLNPSLQDTDNDGVSDGKEILGDSAPFSYQCTPFFRERTLFGRCNKIINYKGYTLRIASGSIDVISQYGQVIVSTPCTNNPMDALVFGNHLYVAMLQDGLQIYDLSNIPNVSKVAKYDEPGMENSFRLVMRAPLLFMLNENNQATVLNVSDPTQPALVRTLSNQRTHTSYFSASGDLVYTGIDPIRRYHLSETGDIISIGDLAIESTFNINIRNYAVHGDTLFVSADSGLYLFDIFNPSNPRKLAQYKALSTVGSFTFTPYYAFLGYERGGVEILDIRNPTAPRHVGYLPTESQVLTPFAEGSKLYANTSYSLIWFNILGTDSNHNRVSDIWEQFYSVTDLNDADSDGLDSYGEFINGTSPTNQDTDGDGISDFIEIINKMPPLEASLEDADNDGLTNTAEARHNSNPYLADSDGDGLSDIFEVSRDIDPNNMDTDGDGFSDKEEIDNQTDPLVPNPSTPSLTVDGVRRILDAPLLKIVTSGIDFNAYSEDDQKAAYGGSSLKLSLEHRQSNEIRIEVKKGQRVTFAYVGEGEGTVVLTDANQDTVTLPQSESWKRYSCIVKVTGELSIGIQSTQSVGGGSLNLDHVVVSFPTMAPVHLLLLSSARGI